jgi:transposase
VTFKNKNIPAITDPNDILQALVAVKEVRILSYQRVGPMFELAIEQMPDDVRCRKCNSLTRVKDRRWVSYVDLPAFGTNCRLLWRKHRMFCPNEQCDVRSFTLEDHRIAAKNCLLTTRAAKWVTKQVGMVGRTVSDVAKELGCDWEVVNNAVVYYGQALLAADRKRLRDTDAVGLDETRFNKIGKYQQPQWATTVADVANHSLIEILPGRNYVDIARWFNNQPHHFTNNLRYGALDLSNSYAAVYSVALPRVIQVVDPFHCLRLATTALDQIRRRVQVEQTGHRGRREDPLYKVRRLLLMNSDKLDEEMTQKINTLLSLGDPSAEVALAYRVKEALRDFYGAKDIEMAEETLQLIVDRCSKKAMPKELQVLARTIKRWFNKIMAWHQARVSNGPTEALNNLIKRIKRIGFGFTNFRNYRIRALLYAGKPNWRVLDSIVVT